MLPWKRAGILSSHVHSEAAALCSECTGSRTELSKIPVLHNQKGIMAFLLGQSEHHCKHEGGATVEPVLCASHAVQATIIQRIRSNGESLQASRAARRPAQHSWQEWAALGYILRPALPRGSDGDISPWKGACRGGRTWTSSWTAR